MSSSQVNGITSASYTEQAGNISHSDDVKSNKQYHSLNLSKNNGALSPKQPHQPTPTVELTRLPDSLTPHQQKFLIFIAHHPELMLGEVKSMCEQAGVDRTSFYDWINNRDFIKYWNEIADLVLDASLPGVKLRNIQRAMGNSTADTKLIYQLKRLIGADSETNTQVNISLPNWSDD